MGIELVNLSNETKAYLNNLRRAVEKQTMALDRLARQRRPKFVEFPAQYGVISVRADRVDVVLKNQDSVFLDGYRVNLAYDEVIAQLNAALGVTGGEGQEGGAE